MELYINTSKNEYFSIAILKDGQIVDEITKKAKFRQSEKLLSAINDILKANKISLKTIKKIKVESSGEGFSALRIGVVTANALAYALMIRVEKVDGESVQTKNFSMVRPKYASEPNIG